MKSSWIYCVILAGVLSLASCTEKNTNEPGKSYELWASSAPGKGVQAIHGKYWQSARFSKEYIVYLELKVSSEWQKQYILQNGLKPINIHEDVILPADAPLWFAFKNGFKAWKMADGGSSLYFNNPLTGHFFIYEEQL